MLEMTEEACERCGTLGPEVHKVPCMTAYADKKQNVDPVLCPECWVQYKSYWDWMWDEYNRGRG